MREWLIVARDYRGYEQVFLAYDTNGSTGMRRNGFADRFSRGSAVAAFLCAPPS